MNQAQAYSELILDHIYTGDVLQELQKMPSESVNCCVTSPPYWGLRDYGMPGQLGNEKTPELFIENNVKVFREVKRVLKKEGTLWLNIGDSYAAAQKKRTEEQASRKSNINGSLTSQIACKDQMNKIVSGLKAKDLVGIPWMLAFALRADGWYLRCDIIWAKKNCMPESVTDRPTRSHEYIFLLTKGPKYYYDYDAIKEPAIWDVDGTGTAARKARQSDQNKSMPDGVVAGIRPSGFKDAKNFSGKNSLKNFEKQDGHGRKHKGFNDRWEQKAEADQLQGMRNKRDVWTISPAQFPEAHFATFPEEIPEICIKAGCPIDGIVLDPFMGAGTTAVVAGKLQRRYVGIELNPKYVQIAETRLKKELGMFYKSA